MTWGKVSDDLHGHPKWRGVSPNAKALWCTALSYCNAYLTNGVIDDSAAAQIAMETFGPTREAFDLFDAAAAELVEVRAPECRSGLWKRRRGGGYVFHQWTEHQPEAEDEKLRKMRGKRKHELHNTAKGRRLKAQVIERDRNRCRYCGCELEPDSRQFDHVDPNGANTLANVVLTCGRCNRRKSNRTLEDAGMTLLEPQNADRSADRGKPRIASDALRGGRGRVGPGRVGPGSAGPDRAGAGSVVGIGVDQDEVTEQWLRQQHEQTIRETA